MSNINSIEGVKSSINQLLESNKFSGNILIDRDGDILFRKSYGLANHDFEIANTSQIKFLIASITKSVTGLAIAILADQGKLNIEDSLDVYIPDFIRGDQITIYHLLTHTSGVCDIDKTDDFKYNSGTFHTIMDYINEFKSKPLEFEPGARFEYSNFGYILLTYIIEKVSGIPYEQFIKENIFDKVSMNDTGLYHSKHILKNKASGYTKNQNEVFKNEDPNLSTHGAGNLYSTIDDIHSFTKGVLSGRFLSEGFYNRYLSEHVHAEEDFYYGYGFMVYQPKDEIEFIYQDGGISGFRSIYMIYPRKDIKIILLSNFDSVPVPDIAEKIGSMLMSLENSSDV